MVFQITLLYQRTLTALRDEVPAATRLGSAGLSADLHYFDIPLADQGAQALQREHGVM
ncbi:hypothetical protein [Paenibacillus sp. N3.4]|uniref:hypothetical protein n=1 Tax=Paenibacillus sp. N3.4 TaxID=2603222 RepID=UPI00165036E5|nr:hypothetical protein [Paenibacillus sp. N3.4]